MDIKQLQYFVTSTDCGSFKKAADLLYTSQPHISKCIKALEDELQVELLHRKARGVELTEAGKSVYYTARKMLMDAEKITGLQYNQGKKNLRVGCQISDFLSWSVAEYIRITPLDSMEIQFLESELNQLMIELNHRHIDLAFVYINHAMMPAFTQSLENRHLQFYPLAQLKMNLLVGPSNPYYRNTSISEKELKTLRFIQFQENADFFRRDSSVPLLSNDPFGNLEEPIITNSRQLILQLLMNSNYSILNCNFNPKLFGESKIHSLPITSSKLKYTFGYLQNSRESLSEQAQDLVNYIKQSIYNRPDA